MPSEKANPEDHPGMSQSIEHPHRDEALDSPFVMDIEPHIRIGFLRTQCSFEALIHFRTSCANPIKNATVLLNNCPCERSIPAVFRRPCERIEPVFDD
jgi:hypothetical protein